MLLVVRVYYEPLGLEVRLPSDLADHNTQVEVRGPTHEFIGPCLCALCLTQRYTTSHSLSLALSYIYLHTTHNPPLTLLKTSLLSASETAEMQRPLFPVLKIALHGCD